MPRYPTRALVAANVLALLALGAWFRVTSPGFAPRTDGDEAWIAIQGGELIEGRAVRTATGNPLNPFFAPLHLPVLGLLGPSAPSLRAPAALCGILTIPAVYLLLAGALGRSTAAIAALLVAVSPMAIVVSRVGYDYCQLPIAAAVALAFAFRGKTAGMLLAIAAGFLIHPTFLFASPAILLVHAASCLRTPDLRRRWARAILPAVLVAITAVPIAHGRRDRLSEHWQAAGTDRPGSVSPGAYAGTLGALLLGFSDGNAIDPDLEADGRPSAWAAGSLALVVLAAGACRLARARHWDRLALVAGLLIGVSGFYLSSRSHPIVSQTIRYHAFLIVPGAAALACLLRVLFVGPSASESEPGRLRGVVRAAQVAGLIAACWALLACARLGYFATWERRAGGVESIWTYRTESIDPIEEAMRIVLRDRARLDASGAGGGLRLIVADDWWTYWPARYHASGRDDLRIVSYLELGNRPEDRDPVLRGLIDRGALTIGFLGGGLDAAITAAGGADGLRRWYVQAGDSPCVVVARLPVAGESEILRRALGDPSPFDRLSAAESLWKHFGIASESVPALAAIVGDRGAPPFVRVRAIGLLDAFGDEALAAAPALDSARDDPDPDLGSRAASLADRLARSASGRAAPLR